MNETTFLIILMLLAEIPLWSIPPLRRCNNNWGIALKSLPAGLIALCLSDRLLFWIFRQISEIKMQNIPVPSWLGFAIPPAAALIVIVCTGILIRYFFKPEGKYNFLPSLGVFIVSLPFFAILYLFCSIIFGFNSNYRSDWKTIWLELGTKEKIAFEQQSIHPFLAEYNYRLRFIRNGKSIRRNLFTNCGGKTHFNIYRQSRNLFVFRDKDWDYLVDTDLPEVYRLAAFNGKTYAAPLIREQVNSWSGPYEQNTGIFMDFNHTRVPAELFSGIMDKMEYCGCITDQFYSAQKKREIPIRFTQKR